MPRFPLRIFFTHYICYLLSCPFDLSSFLHWALRFSWLAAYLCVLSVSWEFSLGPFLLDPSEFVLFHLGCTCRSRLKRLSFSVASLGRPSPQFLLCAPSLPFLRPVFPDSTVPLARLCFLFRASVMFFAQTCVYVFGSIVASFPSALVGCPAHPKPVKFVFAQGQLFPCPRYLPFLVAKAYSSPSLRTLSSRCFAKAFWCTKLFPSQFLPLAGNVFLFRD